MCAIFSTAQAQVKPNLSAPDLTDTQERAKKIYERLTGTKLPADSPAITQMTALLQQGDSLGAAKVATQDPNFYNITVKLMALPLSTREESVKTPLNDFVADFIGVTRDQTDARELLSGNFFYMGNATGVRGNVVADVLLSNNNYDDMEKTRADLSAVLVRVEGQQLATSATASVANPDPAGVLTSRAYMGAHALAGTNRRIFEYSLREFACTPLAGVADTSASDARIGRDIDRFPAGDHTKFLTSCKGCHTIQDGFRGAFARWDFTGTPAAGGLLNSAVHARGNGQNFTIEADANGVVNKMNKNGTIFPSGFVTVNNSFVNNAIRGTNIDFFGWRGTINGGTGAKDYGAMLANSRRFSQCMAKRVYETVCRKAFDETANRSKLVTWGDEFEASGYKLKSLFESMAVKPECM
jgi:hypothetical protein